MSINAKEISIVHWFPDIEKHRCGYCKQENSSISYGMWAENMTVTDYQHLIDRGWRRSGKYCYKPIMSETCCPQYTIRNDALNFKTTKSQKKVVKKLKKFLSDGILNKENKAKITDDDDNYSNVVLKERPNCIIDFTELNEKILERNDDPTNDAPSCSEERIVQNNVAVKVNKKPKIVQDVNSSNVKKGVGADPDKPPCKKAKVLRQEKKQKKLMEKGMSLEKAATNEVKTLRQLIDDVPENCKHKLKMKLISTSNPGGDLIANFDIEYAVYRKYQTVIHNDPPTKCTQRGFKSFLVDTPLKIELVRMHQSHALFRTSADLFAKYQMAIHGDKSWECGESQFLEFLVDTPFENEEIGDDEVAFGSFHQQYWLDDKLIAVGVIDILPKCISSVYFFYDPDYRSLTLGTYGSLREVQLVQSLNEKVPSISYYYMGFYIHSCVKMRYKGKLQPSDLLCPETFEWFPIEKCISKLDASKYARLNEDLDALDENACSEQDVESIKILVGYNYTTFKYYKYRTVERDTYLNVGKLIGKKCSNTLLFVSRRH